MSTDPYAPPASSAYNSRSESRKPSSGLAYVVGIVSVTTFAYMACLHGLLVLFAARGQIHHMDVVVSYPPIMTIHIFVCTIGVAVAVYLLINAFRNRRIRLGHRLLWGMAIAAGYGMVFYWYRHIRLQTRE